MRRSWRRVAARDRTRPVATRGGTRASGAITSAGVAGVAGVISVATVLALGGCATTNDGTSGRDGSWAPPRGGLVTHELAGPASELAGRSDVRLGHVRREREVHTYTSIQDRSRLSTTGSGRITDSVSRRVTTTTIFRGP